MANTKRNKSGYYEKTITIGHRINAAGNTVPVRKKFYGKTLKELHQKIDDFKEDQRLGIENRKQYFGVLADNWLTEFFMQDGSLKDSTRLLYLDSWNRIIRPLPLYHSRLNEVTAKTLQSAINTLVHNGTPTSSIKQSLKLLKRFYRYIETENLGRNVTGSLTVPKDNKNKASDENTIVVWSDDEIRAIFDGFENADPRFRLRFLIVLAYFTGARKSELLALTYDDITADGIKITKTLSDVTDDGDDGSLIRTVAATDPKSVSSIRTIPIDPIVLEELRIHRKWHRKEMMQNGYRTDFIFTTDSGEFYNRKNIDTALTRYYKRIDVTPKSMHVYRHTYASNLSKNNIPIETASSLLGHSDISCTAKYYTSISADAKKAAAMTLRRALEA